MDKLYRLNAEERKIIELAREGNPDPFTDFYLRGPNTGTWWLPGATRPNWKRGYTNIHRWWQRNGKPDKFVYDAHEYQAVWNHERKADFPTDPAFHHNHGFKLLDFGKELYSDRTPTRVLVGGKGSGKTLQLTVDMLVYAAIWEDFRGFALAPEAKQANEVLKLAAQVMRGTLYEKRFRRHYTKSPNALMVIGNDLVGETTIECYPLLKREDSLLTLTGDCAIIDQAEKFDDLETLLIDVGTRFRGRVIETGRGRLGTLTLLANSDFNDALWRIYDQAEDDEQHYWSRTISTFDNPYLTERDLANFESYMGDAESQRVHMLGGRPLGDGKEFSADVLVRMKDDSLETEMEVGLAAGLPGYSQIEAKHVGIHEWLLPPKAGHTYLVVSDPGTANPPKRDAYAILVWDITEFPGTKADPKPAKLAGYIWGFGRGDITNWANKHAELTWRYQAVGNNAFDATGFQAGYDELMVILMNLFSEKINLSGNAKANCLNAAKWLSAAGYLKVPGSLVAFFNQLQRYELPEPAGRKAQDLVITYIMSCWWMQRRFWMVNPAQRTGTESHTALEDRHDRTLEGRESILVDF